jgi:hypothetical protein
LKNLPRKESQTAFFKTLRTSLSDAIQIFSKLIMEKNKPTARNARTSKSPSKSRNNVACGP